MEFENGSMMCAAIRSQDEVNIKFPQALAYALWVVELAVGQDDSCCVICWHHKKITPGDEGGFVRFVAYRRTIPSPVLSGSGSKGRGRIGPPLSLIEKAPRALLC
jgi:hypothetical protein